MVLWHYKEKNVTFFQSFAYRNLLVHEYVSQPLRCHSDLHTSTGHCCCGTDETCSNPPHRTMAGTDLQVKNTHVTNESRQGSPKNQVPLQYDICIYILHADWIKLYSWLFCVPHQAVSSPFAFCWYWTVLLYKANLKRTVKGLWWPHKNCRSRLFCENASVCVNFCVLSALIVMCVSCVLMSKDVSVQCGSLLHMM